MRPGEIYYSDKDYKIIDAISNNGQVAFFVIGLDRERTYYAVNNRCISNIESFKGEHLGTVEHNDNYYILIANALRIISEDMKSRFPELPEDEVRPGSVYKVDECKYIMISHLAMQYTEYYELEIHPGTNLKVDIKAVDVKTKDFTIPENYIGRVPIMSTEYLDNMSELLRVINNYLDKTASNYHDY